MWCYICVNNQWNKCLLTAFFTASFLPLFINPSISFKRSVPIPGIIVNIKVLVVKASTCKILVHFFVVANKYDSILLASLWSFQVKILYFRLPYLIHIITKQLISSIRLDTSKILPWILDIEIISVYPARHDIQCGPIIFQGYLKYMYDKSVLSSISKSTLTRISLLV